MARSSRSSDWGFPRWRGYGADREAVSVRLCDRHGCNEPGDCPAPKSPNSPERWYFCQAHAAEYNRGWDYFEGLSAEDAAAREADERRDASGYTQSRQNAWAGPGDGTRSRDEMRALDVLELEVDATFDDVRAAWRRLAKANHPDVTPNDAEAAVRFQAIQAAYEVLRAAEEARTLEACVKLASARWRGAVLVCAKCSKKAGGGFGRKGRTALAKALREVDGFGKGRKAEIGVAEVKCLGLCPGGGVTLVDTRRPGEWLVVSPGEDVAALAARLRRSPPSEKL